MRKQHQIFRSLKSIGYIISVLEEQIKKMIKHPVSNKVVQDRKKPKINKSPGDFNQILKTIQINQILYHLISTLDLPVVGTLSSNTSSVITDAKPCLLDTFFPFDPYRLRKSKVFFVEMYREYQGSLEGEGNLLSDACSSIAVLCRFSN